LVVPGHFVFYFVFLDSVKPVFMFDFMVMKHFLVLFMEFVCSIINLLILIYWLNFVYLTHY